MRLNDGREMPVIGLGMWDLRGQECQNVVAEALASGYRSFDSAQMYGNEKDLSLAIKSAIKEGLVRREEVFLTTKIIATSYDEARQKIDESARLFETYIDLMLIHWPRGHNTKVYRALEDAQESGIIKSCGISNFHGRELEELLGSARILPAVNQCQTHIYQQNKDLRKQLENYSIALVAYSPFGGPPNAKNILKNPVLSAIAQKHGKTPAQISLAWLRAENIIAIPKTCRKERLKENLESLEIELDKGDMEAIRALDTGSDIQVW